MRDEPLSTIEIARLFDVQPGTVHSWRQRGIFPEPDRMVSNTPIWFASTVSAWANTHGRNVSNKFPSAEFVVPARQAEEGIRATAVALAGVATSEGDRGSSPAVADLAAALIPLAEVVTQLARARDEATRTIIDDIEELKGLARDEIRKLVLARFRAWARLVESEYDGLADAVFQAAMEPSLAYDYPLNPAVPMSPEDSATMRLAKGTTALTISADGRRETLRQIGEEHRRIVAQVRAWDVWRRIRPGPL